MLNENTREELRAEVWDRELMNLNDMGTKEILRIGVTAITDYDDQSLIDYCADVLEYEDDIEDLTALVERAKLEMLVNEELTE